MHNARSTGDCFHCGLPIAAGADYHARLDGAERQFCCFGCQSVCSAIFEAGLQGYYQRTPEGTLLAPPPEPPQTNPPIFVPFVAFCSKGSLNKFPPRISARFASEFNYPTDLRCGEK